MNFKDYLREKKKEKKIKSYDLLPSADYNKQIEKIKKAFGGNIPPTFELYLQEIGVGSVRSFEIFGLSRINDQTQLIYETDTYTKPCILKKTC